MKILIILLFVNFAFGLPDLVSFENEHRHAKPIEEHPDLKEVLNQFYPDNESNIRKGGRILNGIPATLGQFPYQALLYMNNPTTGWYICGGSFIKYNFVITAAHCLKGFTQVIIYGGILDRQNGPAYYKNTITNKTQLFVHEKYNETSLVNDIGLALMLGAPKNLLTGYASIYIAGIKLPLGTDSSVVLDGKTASISGFGKYNDTTQSLLLRYGSAPIISNTECVAVYGKTVTSGNICISTTGGYGTCSGDSGGPLVVQIRAGEKTLVGVTSFGAAAGCALKYPTGFSRTTFFLSWINAKIAPYP